MKIQQLLLRNVRNIKELDLDFRDPVTGKPMSRVVLAGANGSGKTTILESLFGLLVAAGKHKNPTGGTVYFKHLEDVNFQLSPSAQVQIIFDAELPNTSPISTLLSVSYGVKGAIVDNLSIANSVVGGQSPQPRQAITPENIKGEDLLRRIAVSIQNAREQSASSIGAILYFPSNRYLPAFQQGELGLEPNLYQWSYRYLANDRWKGSTESYLFSLNYLDLEDRDHHLPADRFGQAVELVNSILVNKHIARIQKGRVVIETAEGQTHGLADLSSGEKQLTLLLIEVSRRIVPGSVILIDEPEISLHEAWQRGLMAALDKIIEQYDAQVILATHSVEIATCVMPHEVISLNNLGLPLGQWEPEKEALP